MYSLINNKLTRLFEPRTYTFSIKREAFLVLYLSCVFSEDTRVMAFPHIIPRLNHVHKVMKIWGTWSYVVMFGQFWLRSALYVVWRQRLFQC